MAENYTYCFLRKDLPPVVRAIQLAHAGMELGKMLDSDEPIANLVLFEVANEQELIKVDGWLEEIGIEKRHMFYEPDYDTGYTAIAVGPLTGEQRVPFSRFTLFKWEHEPDYMASRRELIAA